MKKVFLSLICIMLIFASACGINIEKLDNQETYPAFSGSLEKIYTSLEQLEQDADIIAEAGAGMAHFEGSDAETVAVEGGKITEFDGIDAEGKIGRDDGERLDDFPDAARAGDGEGFGMAFVSHGKKETGEAADMVGMEMRD